jgi:hypothetical protein
MDYYSQYLKQIKKTTYPNYDKYMDIYYSRNKDYDRFMKDNLLILIDKKKKEEITITHGKYINLYEYKNNLEIEYNDLISNVEDDLF